jgi:putative flippase GtrA
MELQISRETLLFVLIGVGATAIDFGFYNWFSRPPLCWNRIWANLLSTSLGMLFKFLANWHVVFRAEQVEWKSTLANFVLVNAVSSYGIQTAVILVCSRIQLPPAEFSSWVARSVSCNSELFSRNAVKCLAIAFGMSWNFAWCKWVVFQ